MHARLPSILAGATLAAAIFGGIASGGGGAVQASAVSAPVLVPPGSSASGQGIVLPSFDGTSVTVAITAARANATFRVSACQSVNILGTSTCATAATNNTVTADGSGSINAMATLPAIQELDSIVIQDVVDASDAYYANAGPNPPITSPVVLPSAQVGLLSLFPGLVANAVPSSSVPYGTCPVGLTGFLLLNTGNGIIVVSCP